MDEVRKPQFQMAFSAICPDDLGLKAGFWKQGAGSEVEFRDIVGWITVQSRTVPSNEPVANGFYAVVLGPLMYPVGACELAGYCGVFLKGMAEPDARKLAMEWASRPEGVVPQPNVRDVGQA